MYRIKNLISIPKRNKQYVKELEKELAKLREKENKKPSRGVETMFRITVANHMTLSGMADAKANIMISINSPNIKIV